MVRTMHFSFGSALEATTGAIIVVGTAVPGIVAGTGTGTGTGNVAGTGTGTGIVAGAGLGLGFGFGCASAVLARAARREVRRRMMVTRRVTLNGEMTMLMRIGEWV